MSHYNPRRVPSPKVLPTLFGPFGRKWLDLSRLRARVKIAQGPEYHAEPSTPPKEPRKPAQHTAGDINKPTGQKLPSSIQGRVEQAPPTPQQEDLGGIEDVPGMETVGGWPVQMQGEGGTSTWAEKPASEEGGQWLELTPQGRQAEQDETYRRALGFVDELLGDDFDVFTDLLKQTEYPSKQDFVADAVRLVTEIIAENDLDFTESDVREIERMVGNEAGEFWDEKHPAAEEPGEFDLDFDSELTPEELADLESLGDEAEANPEDEEGSPTGEDYKNFVYDLLDHELTTDRFDPKDYPNRIKFLHAVMQALKPEIDERNLSELQRDDLANIVLDWVRKVWNKEKGQ